MRSQSPPGTLRATPRSVPRKTTASAAAPPRQAAKARKAKTASAADAPVRPDGPGAATPPALSLAPGPTLLEGPTRDEMIRLRAYERYERNGCVDGHELDDWLAAEAEVGALFDAGREGAAEPCS